MVLQMTIPELTEFLDEQFPQIKGDFEIVCLSDSAVTVRFLTAKKHLRPGGTVSGPAMFALADVAMYIAVLSRIGPRALAVTTNCTINFMRKPTPESLTARATILKSGRTLCVGEVGIFSGQSTDPVAHAVLTYSIPPEAAAKSRSSESSRS